MESQIEQCEKLLNVLKALVQQIGENPLTQKIEVLCGAKFSSPSLILLTKKVELEAYALSQRNWIRGLLWVIKLQRKELRKARFPFNNLYFQFCEPFGIRINAELELWAACLDFIDEFKLSGLTPFNTALDGWFATTQERMLQPIQNMPKETQLLFLREEIEQLETDINPHNPNKGEKELYNLINLVLAIKNPQKCDNNDLKRKRKAFRDGIWAAYIKAHKEWFRRYKNSEAKAVLIDNDQLKYRLSGRQTRLIAQPLREDFRFRKKNKSLNIGSVQGFQEFAPKTGGNENP